MAVLAIASNILAPPSGAGLDTRPAPLPRPEVARLTALGFDAFLGDMYWVGALQYFGGQAHRPECYEQLKDYLNLTAALAPDFWGTYRMAGVAVPCNDGKGWHHVGDAAALLRKGIDRFPENWFLRFLLAYDLTLVQQFREASAELALAARVAGAPEFYAGLATRLMVKAGDLDAAQEMAESLLGSASDEQLRRTLETRVREIEAHRNLRALESAVATFKAQTGRWPSGLSELVEASLLARIPEPTLAKEWKYDGAKGTVRPLVPLPQVAPHVDARAP